MIEPPPLKRGERLQRFLRARKELRQASTPLKGRVKAVAALVNTNFRVNQGINMTSKYLGIPNNRRRSIDNLGESIKRSLKNENPFSTTNEIRNKAIRTMANYISFRIGFRNNLNTERVYQLIIKIMRLKADMNAAPNNATRRDVGKDLGLLLGELVLTFVRTRQPGNGRGRTVGLGFLNGILTKILGPRIANTVNRTIKMTQNVKKWYSTVPTSRIEEVN